MSYADAPAIADALRDTALSAGFGFAAGLLWQLFLLPFGGKKRRPAAMAVSLLFGAGGSFFAMLFIIGRTGSRVMRWYIALGMLLGLMLWRMAGWQLLRRGLTAAARGPALLFGAAARLLLLPLKALRRLRRQKQPPSCKHSENKL